MIKIQNAANKYIVTCQKVLAKITFSAAASWPQGKAHYLR